MPFYIKLMRLFGRSNSTLILTFIVIVFTFIGFQVYQKGKNSYDPDEGYSQVDHKKDSSPISTTKISRIEVQKIETDKDKSVKVPEIKPIEVPKKEATKSVDIDPTATNTNVFAQHSTDAHLHSLLEKQGNSEKQVIATIIGGDSYSLFAWDWYERMLEISNDTNNCHCFVIAMDEIAVVMAIQQGVPVFYSTFTFEQQMKWINNIEARQHSLYRVGHAKFDTTARIIRFGYSVMLSEMDVFWRQNPLDYLKLPSNAYDFQISHHYGAHPRVNIGVFYSRSTKALIEFFNYVAEFWLRYGKGGYLSDQRVLDALLNNYDRLDKTYTNAMKPLALTFNWTTHDFGNHYGHLMTDGSAFILFSQAAKANLRSKKFYGNTKSKYFTVTVTNVNMSTSQKNLLIRALLIIQHTQLPNRTLIFPAFTSNLTVTQLPYQLDIKKFLLYWKEDRVRLPDFLLLEKSQTINVTNLPYDSKKSYADIDGILNFTIESIPLNLPSPSPQFDVQVRDSLLWCSPPLLGGAWCIHHPRDFGATMEILFACRGDPYPPCANKTEKNEQFLERPYELLP